MNIELISPAVKVTRNRRPLSLFSPFNLAVLAAHTPDDFNVCITDEEIEEIDYDKRIDLLGITAYTPKAMRAYEIADTFRAKGVPVVLGGFHPSFLPEEAGLHADAVVIGEAEDAWPELLSDFRNGHLKKQYRSERRTDLSGLPSPKLDLLKTKNYVFPYQVSITRGCPFSCKFCSITSFHGGTHRLRPLDEVVKEIEHFKSLKRRSGFLEIDNCIHFIDDNLIARTSFAKELFRALIPLRIKWIGSASLTVAEDEELMRLASESGCIGLFMGIETINQETLDSVRKRANVSDNYEKALKKIHSFGLGIQGSFIFGFDEDDESVFERTVRFAQRAKLELVEFHILTPYPGTRLYQELEREGRILTTDWSKYDAGHVVFQPKRMSPEALTKGIRWAWKEFYRFRSIFNRVGLFHRATLSTWALNLHTRSYFERFF